MLASVFVVQGVEALTHPDPLVSRARRVTDRVGPTLGNLHPTLAETRTLVMVNAAVMAGGGVLLLTSLRRAAALAVAAALVPTTLAGHAFWDVTDTGERKQHRIRFLGNLGLLGGLLLAAADTEGRPGLRWRTGHLMSDASHSVQRAAHGRTQAATIGAAIGRGMRRK
jgi:uncharacterized membrane protein YphA (DoxX/SURF4 family)